MKKRSKIIIGTFLFFIAISPILSYGLKFGFNIKNISGQNANWAAFGSFIGGIYSSIFSFASVLILSITLYLTRENNKEQIRLIKQESTIKDFNLLVEQLLNHFSSPKKYTPRIRDEENFLHRLDIDIRSNLNIYQASSFEDVVEQHIRTHTYDLYNEEANIMINLASIFEMIPDDLRSVYKTVFNSKISNDRRFLLKTYMKTFKFNISNTFIDKSDFCEPPQNLRELKEQCDRPF
ncbi:hypothetical protein I5M85_17400 [Serratia marcescens]|nr:hypothetical protein [Serratia marcescens]HEJ6919504.1 hypothetical protein [Serratia marcescens]